MTVVLAMVVLAAAAYVFRDTALLDEDGRLVRRAVGGEQHVVARPAPGHDRHAQPARIPDMAAGEPLRSRSPVAVGDVS